MIATICGLTVIFGDALLDLISLLITYLQNDSFSLAFEHLLYAIILLMLLYAMINVPSRFYESRLTYLDYEIRDTYIGIFYTFFFSFFLSLGGDLFIKIAAYLFVIISIPYILGKLKKPTDIYRKISEMKEEFERGFWVNLISSVKEKKYEFYLTLFLPTASLFLNFRFFEYAYFYQTVYMLLTAIPIFIVYTGIRKGWKLRNLNKFSILTYIMMIPLTYLYPRTMPMMNMMFSPTFGDEVIRYASVGFSIAIMSIYFIVYSFIGVSEASEVGDAELFRR
ncbi:MAG: hypothetical protein ACTSVF_03750, partial [Candidatus Asgardarchaeia archaeon]